MSERQGSGWGWRRGLVQAAVISVAASALGLAVNALRAEPLPWLAQQPYTLVVPCPTQTGNALALAASDPQALDERSLVIDARTKADFAAWHVPSAMFVEFDWLGPPVDEEVQRIAERVARSGSQRVVVYGDGDDPDSGEQWARLLVGAGLKHVFYVVGGAPALQARAGEQP